MAFGGIAHWLRHLPGLWFAVVVAVLGAAMAAGFLLIWGNLRRARIIEDTPTARLRSAPQGYVEIEGRGSVMDGPPIRAPLTGTPCLWWRYRVERRHQQVDRRGRRSGYWATVHGGHSDDLFLLEDGTGRCVVDPHGAEVTPGVRQVWYGDSEWPRLGPRLGGGLLGAYRYTEERLMAGPLYALGWFRTVTNADLPVAEEVRAVLRQWKRDPPTLARRFDINGDGHVDAGEWSQARQMAIRQVLRERRRATATATNTLVRPEESDYPFILAAERQEALAGRYRLQALGALAGLLLVGAGLLWALAVRLG